MKKAETPRAGAGGTSPQPARELDEAQSAIESENYRLLESLDFHEYAKLFPLMNGEEFDRLVEDVRKNGLREPIVVSDGKIADGQNRFLACFEAGVEIKKVEWDGEGSLLDYVVSKNLARRHLDAGQRAMIAAGLADHAKGRPRGNAHGCGLTEAAAAAKLDVSTRLVQHARKVKKKGVAELREAAAAGKVNVTRAAAIAGLPPAEQAAALASGEGPAPARAKKAKPSADARAGRPEDETPGEPSPPAAAAAAPAVTTAGFEPDLPPGSWLAAFPLRAELADPASFDLEATLWYTFDTVCRRLPPAASSLARRAHPVTLVQNGRLAEMFRRVLPPDGWKLCPACKGQGGGGGARGCDACYGHGFLTKHRPCEVP